MREEIVGRGAEIAAIDRFLASATAELAGLVLEGEPGIGKTTIWEAAVAAAEDRGFLVLRSRPTYSEQHLTLGGLTDVFATVDVAALDGLPAPQRQALGVALLREGPGPRSPDQRTLAVATAGALRLLTGSNRPVLVALDDVQWLDQSSAAILAYAVRRLADRPIGLLLSVRPARLHDAARDLVASVPAERVERQALGPLPLAALHRLFQRRLGRSFPRLALVRIEAACGGNPLYALEIGRALARSGAEVAPAARLPVPDSLGSLMRARIAALSAATRHALTLSAAASHLTLATIQRAEPGAEEALGPAIEEGIVVIEGDDVRFAHPLLAQAVLAMAAAADVRAAHLALAATADSDEARARHLGEAADGPDELVAAALEQAARSARDRGATVDASALYARAARLTPPDGDSLARSVLAAECLFVDLSEIVDADAILEAALRDRVPGPSRADALSLQALLRYYHGRVTDAVDLARQALAEAGDEPVLRAKVLGRLAFLTMQLDLTAGVALINEAAGLLERAPGAIDPDLEANVLLLRAVGELGLVRAMRRADIERGLRLITPDGRSWEREGADGSAFGLARLTDDLDRAIEMTRELIRAKSGPGGDDPFNLVQLAGLLCYRGDWPEARRVAEAARDGYEREGADVHPAWALRGVALVAAHDGRVEEARRLARHGLAIATERGDAVVAVFHHQILGFVALSTGDWHGADLELTQASVLADSIGSRHPGRFKFAGDWAEAVLALGDVERARGIVAWLEESAAAAPTPWVEAVGARCRGLLEAACGDMDAACSAFERAMTAHESLPMPFERARTLLAKGQLHRRRKEKRLADECLRASLSLFASLGSPLWAERARVELGRVGLRPRAPDDLTETERRVAELAARGLHSRQIAEQAFLAPKTVGNVLGRIYLKLGIHSRAELGAAMADRIAGSGEGGEATSSIAG